MIPASISTFLGRTAGLVATLVAQVFQVESQADLPSGTSTATLNLVSDGTITRVSGGAGTEVTLVSTGASNWYTPTTGGIGASYEARYVPSYGTNAGTLTDNTWTSLTSSKTLKCNFTDNVVGVLQFRLASTGAMVAVMDVYLEALNGYA